MNFQEACQQVGYTRGLSAPTSVEGFYAYKDGKASEHDTRREAEKVSKNVERFTRNKKEIDAFWDKQRKLEQKASEIFHAALREEYSHLSDKIYALAYAKAYEDGHSSGYDEVANEMIGIVDLIDQVLKAAEE